MNIPDYVEDNSHKKLWPSFENWCRNNGISKNLEDRRMWWNCFTAGATCMYVYMHVKMKEGEFKE